jgi:AcrR family transcriptional regulator
MSQRKKDNVREAILEAAFRLFSERGYVNTSMPAIAKEAGISSANVYVYFQSKIDILFTLYEPWLEKRLDALEKTLARIKEPRRRFDRLLLALWRDLARESGGFANNVMQAISTSAGNGDYSPRLRRLFQWRVSNWIAQSLQVTETEANRLAVAMNAHLEKGTVCDRGTASAMASLLTARSSS